MRNKPTDNKFMDDNIDEVITFWRRINAMQQMRGQPCVTFTQAYDLYREAKNVIIIDAEARN